MFSNLRNLAASLLSCTVLLKIISAGGLVPFVTVFCAVMWTAELPCVPLRRGRKYETVEGGWLTWPRYLSSDGSCPGFPNFSILAPTV